MAAAGPEAAAMSAAVVRIEAEAASTGARAPLKIFAIVNAVVAAQALVEFRGTVGGARAQPIAEHPRRAVRPQRYPGTLARSPLKMQETSDRYLPA